MSACIALKLTIPSRRYSLLVTVLIGLFAVSGYEEEETLDEILDEGPVGWKKDEVAFAMWSCCLRMVISYATILATMKKKCLRTVFNSNVTPINRKVK